MSSDRSDRSSTEPGVLNWLVPMLMIIVIGIMMIAGLKLALSGPSNSTHSNKATPVIDLVDLRVPIAGMDACVSEEGEIPPNTHTLQTVENHGEITFVCVPLTVTPIGTPSAVTPGSRARGNHFRSL